MDCTDEEYAEWLVVIEKVRALANENITLKDYNKNLQERYDRVCEKLKLANLERGNYE